MLINSRLWNKRDGDATVICGVEYLAADISGAMGSIYGGICAGTWAGSAVALGRERAEDADLRGYRRRLL